MTFRRRLLAASMLTLVVGLGALLVVGNVVLGVSANNDQMRLLQSRVDAEIAALTVRDGHVVVRNNPDDQSLDREAWIFDGARVIERPVGGDPAVDRAAMRLGRAGRAAETRGPGRRGDPRRTGDRGRQTGRDGGRGDVGRRRRAPAALRRARLGHPRRAAPGGGLGSRSAGRWTARCGRWRR